MLRKELYSQKEKPFWSVDLQQLRQKIKEGRIWTPDASRESRCGWLEKLNRWNKQEWETKRKKSHPHFWSVRKAENHLWSIYAHNGPSLIIPRNKTKQDLWRRNTTGKGPIIPRTLANRVATLSFWKRTLPEWSSESMQPRDHRSIDWE